MDDLGGVGKVMSNLENQLESHIKTTNQKLDILIELTRQMATMQERQNSHANDIQRLEKSDVDFRQQFLSAIEKIERRVNSSEDESVKAVDKLVTKLELLDTRNNESLKLRDAEFKTMITAVATKLENFESDYKAKYNFSRGVIWVMSIVFVLSQGLVIQAGRNVIDDIEKNKQSITKLETDALTRSLTQQFKSPPQ